MVATIDRRATAGSAGLGRPGLFALLQRRTLLCVVLGTLCAILSATCMWSWRTFANSQGFADRATDMLKEPAVREYVAEQIVTALENQSAVPPELMAARPLVKQVVAEVVGTQAFQGIFHAGVRELHSAVFAGNRSSLRVEVDDAALLVKDSIRLVNPTLAEAIPDGALDVVVSISQSSQADVIMHAADVTTWLIVPFAVLALVFYALAYRSSGDRRHVTEAIGVALVLAGVFAFAVLAVGIQVFAAAGGDPRQRTAMRAVFWSLTHLVNIEAKVFILAGSVVAVSAAYAGAGRFQDRIDHSARAMWQRFERPVWRAVACSVLIVSCLFAMAWPAASAAILVRFLAYVGFVGATVGLLDVVGATAWAEDTETSARRTARRLAKGAVVATCVALAVVLLGVVAIWHEFRGPALASSDITQTGCNGHPELCDEPITEVAFAGTHNSMSSSKYDAWFFPRHHAGIRGQLAAGVRAFLVDLYAGTKFVNVVRTVLPPEELEARTAELRQQQEEPLSEEAQLQVERTLSILGAAVPEGRQDYYLCHGLCELGAVKAVNAFRDIADFLRANPNEVILLVIEDHVPADAAVSVLSKSGLAAHASTWQPGMPVPTLRQMIEQREQVLIMAEHDGGKPGWYHDAYDDAQHGLLQETPFRFESPAEFSCSANRGSTGHPLFLMNHWVETEGAPSAKVAEAINSYDALKARAQRCFAERGHLPNIVAVDFFDRGDLFDVVDALNGLGPAGDLAFASTVPFS